MKKIISLLAITGGLFISNVIFASAQAYSSNGYTSGSSYGTAYNSYNNSYNSNSYTPYYNNYVNAPTSNSYTYVQGCFTYSYDAYTRITSLIGSSCTTNTYTYPTYQTYYTQPTYTYSYVQPAYNYSYVAPTTPYYTYQYDGRTHGWYPGNNTRSNCYWHGGYQRCN